MPLSAHSLLVVGHGLFVVRTVAGSDMMDGRISLSRSTRSRRRKGDDEKGLRCARLQRGQSEFAPGFHGKAYFYFKNITLLCLYDILTLVE